MSHASDGHAAVIKPPLERVEGPCVSVSFVNFPTDVVDYGVIVRVQKDEVVFRVATAKMPRNYVVLVKTF